MPGGRVPPQLLITSRCGGWFEQKEKDTRTVWPPQPAGMNRRLRRAKAPSASYCSLFFPASVPRPDSPWRTEMKTCRLSPPAPPWCVEAWLSLGPSNFTEFHLSSALPPHPKTRHSGTPATLECKFLPSQRPASLQASTKPAKALHPNPQQPHPSCSLTP